MYWKEIGSMDDLSPDTDVLRIHPSLTVILPHLKHELEERESIQIGMIEVKVVKNKILAALPSNPVAHTID